MVFTAQHGLNHTLHHDFHPDPAWFPGTSGSCDPTGLVLLPTLGLLTVTAASLPLLRAFASPVPPQLKHHCLQGALLEAPILGHVLLL